MSEPAAANTRTTTASSRVPNQFRYFRIHDCLELISNAAVPLMIGILSLWIAIHQQNITQLNRQKDIAQAGEVRKQDLEQARLQREEDKAIARLQRAEDRQTAQLQREEDQETARLQRDEDREMANLQRELDLNITYVKRTQDNELAEKERNLSEIQRSYEFEITYENRLNDLALEDDRQKESVLLEYQDDLVTLLLDYGTLLTNFESKWWFILQMKTAAALRQLDSIRRTILIHALLDLGVFNLQAEDQQSILYKTNLSGVEFGESSTTYNSDVCARYDYLHAIESDLRYASFYGVCLYETTSFSFSNLD